MQDAAKRPVFLCAYIRVDGRGECANSGSDPFLFPKRGRVQYLKGTVEGFPFRLTVRNESESAAIIRKDI